MPVRRAELKFAKFVLCSILFNFPVLSNGYTAEKHAERDDGRNFLPRLTQIPGAPVYEEGASKWQLDYRMYLMLSGYYFDLTENAVVNPDNILDKEDTGFLLELNTQNKITFSDKYIFSMDISYQLSPGPGEQRETDTHFNTNEFFIDLFLKELFYIKTGKKRESWSVGNIFYPLDIINPPKNPLDPSKSREGTYLAMVEIPFGTSSFSIVYFPSVEFDPDGGNGIPERMDLEDGGLGIRSYFLLWDTDISIVYFRRSSIPALAKNYYGAALNRFFGYLGTYIEVLGHRGNDNEFIRKDQEGNYYFPDDDERIEMGKADDQTYFDFSLGANYSFSDNTKIGVEYLRNGEGYGRDEFDVFYDFLSHDSELYLETLDERIKGKLLRGYGLMRDRIRRNYIALLIDRPNTFDDFFPRLNAVICLDDGSIAVGGLVDYLVRDDTSVKLVFNSFAGGGETEYGLKPGDRKITLEIKYFW